jgi:hypothetical protein
MNVEDRYRTTMEQLTDTPVGGPDLATSLAAGRRHRRVRRTIVAGGAVAALTVATAGGAWLQRPHAVTTPDSFATSPTYHDFVPGTRIDEDFQATVAQYLPGLPDAGSVYPSDWNHDTALPDAQFENATDWEADYTLNPQEDLVVVMAKDVPGYPLRPKCSEIAVSLGQPTCSVSGLADDARVASYGFTVEVPHGYWFLSVYTAADGSTVTVSQHVGADSWSQAEARRVYTDAQASSLASDTALTFPDPVVTPPAPDGP